MSVTVSPSRPICTDWSSSAVTPASSSSACFQPTSAAVCYCPSQIRHCADQIPARSGTRETQAGCDAGYGKGLRHQSRVPHAVHRNRINSSAETVLNMAARFGDGFFFIPCPFSVFIPVNRRHHIKCVSLHFFMSFKIGIKLFPRSVREYSTFGGTS